MKIFVSIPHGELRNSFIPAALCKRIETMGDVRWNSASENLSSEELSKQIGDAEVCITGWGNALFDEAVLNHAPQLKVIAHTGGSVAALVDESAYARGIRVLSGNELYARSVAEGVICYILCALRKIPFFANEVQTKGWSQPGWYNEGLLDQKVGLVGFGAVARHTARMLRAFGCEILINADHVSPEEAAAYGAKKASLEEIFSTCKVVSLHWAKTPETYHQINARLMSLLHPDSLLVNTARGAIIDEPVLARMLHEGRFHAVLDVYETEPLPKDSPLRGLDNALLIPHMGGPTMDRRPFVTASLLDCLPAALAGEPTRLDIPPEVMRRMTR